MEPTSSLLSPIGHIQTNRLMDLSEQAVLLEPAEIDHLRNCEECDHLLRIFARQFRAMREVLEKKNKSGFPPINDPA